MLDFEHRRRRHVPDRAGRAPTWSTSGCRSFIRDIALFDRRGFNEILKNNREGISSAIASRRACNTWCSLTCYTSKNQTTHAQKKLYFLTEAGIAFVPILFHLASWTAEFREPAPDIVALTKSLSFSGAVTCKRSYLIGCARSM